MKKWTKDENEAIQVLLDYKVPPRKMARIFNVTAQKMRMKIFNMRHGSPDHTDKLRKQTQGFGNPRHWIRWEQDEIDKLLKLKAAGKTLLQIHKELGRSLQAVENKLARLEERRD